VTAEERNVLAKLVFTSRRIFRPRGTKKGCLIISEWRKHPSSGALKTELPIDTFLGDQNSILTPSLTMRGAMISWTRPK
jgi:hypothetical protein